MSELVYLEGVAYRTGDLAPRDCEECDCTEHRWNCRNRMLRTDPPSTCECGHLTSRHRYRPVPH